MGFRVTVLVDNVVYREGLQAEAGLCLLIEKEGQSWLFDTGCSGLFLANAQVLGKDLDDAETVILSHGHWDHTGGLEKLLDMKPGIRVHAHPAALEPKFGRGGRSIGIALGPEKLKGMNFSPCRQVTEIAPGIHALTDVPRVNSFENAEGGFFLDQAGTRPDTLPDDLTLVLDSQEGLIILMGCAHAGPANILDYVQKVFPGRCMRAVIGGTHLGPANCERLSLTLEALKKHRVEFFQPGHCTGLRPLAFFLMQSFVRTEPLHAGAVFPRP